MNALKSLVPEDPAKPGRDVLGTLLTARGHFHHEVLAEGVPVSLKDLGEKAEQRARAAGVSYNSATFAPASTRAHLEFLKKKDFVEQRPDKLWQFTTKAKARLNGVDVHEDSPSVNRVPTSPTMEVRTVDDKGRIMLPKSFANATVMIEMTSDSTIRIQKAVVVAEDSFPTIEDTLPPLSNEDRDFFLKMIENPPPLNDAFRKAAKHYKDWHARNSD